MNDVFDNIIVDIRTDMKSGATSMAGRGLDALRAFAESLAEDDPTAEEQALEIVRRLDEIRPSMGAIGVQALLAVSRARSLVADGVSWRNALERAVQTELRTLGQADRAIATLATREIGSGGTFVSCSYSATALTTLIALKPDHVYMGEGHRMRDGVRGARWLAAREIDVQVVPDGALPVVVEGARAVIVGADQLLADGSVVNRCSTFSLGLAAVQYDVPFYVMCQRIKLSGQPNVLIEESSQLLQSLPSGVTGRVPIFDVTPASLIHRVITESGVMTTDEAGEVGRGIAHLRTQLLE